MRLILDTTAKTIKIDSSVNLGELVEALKKLLPEDEWLTFRLETNTHIVWKDPIIIRDYPSYPYYPNYPWWKPAEVICGNPSDTNYHTLQQGTFCVEIK